MRSIKTLDGSYNDIKHGRWALPICTFVLFVVCLFEIKHEITHFNMLERLSKNGQTSNAIITEKDTIFRKAFNTYIFHYHYQVGNDSDTVKYVSSSVVKKHVYNSKNNGDTITITYNQLAPLESSFGNILNVSKQQIFNNNWLYYSALIMATVILLLMTVFLFVDCIYHIRRTA